MYQQRPTFIPRPLFRERSPIRRAGPDYYNFQTPGYQNEHFGNTRDSAQYLLHRELQQSVSPNKQPTPSIYSQLLEVVIIPLNSLLGSYAREVENRLKTIGLITLIEELRQGGQFPEAISYFAEKGALFVIWLEPAHRDFRSLSLHICAGNEEHRNMPLDAAVTLIKDVAEKRFTADFLSSTNLRSVEAPESLATPRYVGYLMHLLADCRYLTAKELETVAKYVEKRRLLVDKEFQESKKKPEPKESNAQAKFPQILLQQPLPNGISFA